MTNIICRFEYLTVIEIQSLLVNTVEDLVTGYRNVAKVTNQWIGISCLARNIRAGHEANMIQRVCSVINQE